MTSSTISTFLLLAFLLFHGSNAATFTIRNNCQFPVWAGAVPGGGQQLNPGQTWNLNVPAGTKGARIWPRTKCNFDGSGRGRCETGDCNGLLRCQSYGVPPNTLAEYALNQYNNLDFFDISLVDGFNVPMEFSPNSGGCTRGIRCTADINGQCPVQLRAPGNGLILFCHKGALEMMKELIEDIEPCEINYTLTPREDFGHMKTLGIECIINTSIMQKISR